jgi:hypothetical protein
LPCMKRRLNMHSTKRWQVPVVRKPAKRSGKCDRCDQPYATRSATRPG